MMVHVAEQILGQKSLSSCPIPKLSAHDRRSKDAQENGTYTTIFPLHNAKLEDLLTADLDNRIMSAPPLTPGSLQLTEPETELLLKALIHTILQIIIRHGGDGFKYWQKDLDSC